MFYPPQAPLPTAQALPDLSAEPDNTPPNPQAPAKEAAAQKVKRQAPKPQVKVSEKKRDLAYTFVKDNPCLYDKGNYEILHIRVLTTGKEIVQTCS